MPNVHKYVRDKQKEIEWLEFVAKCEELDKAIAMLKHCVNWDNAPMRTGIGGELEEKIREFIRRCGGVK